MTLRNDVELANTRAKLARLEARVAELRRDDDEGDRELHDTTIRSLVRLVNQLKEEIIRYEARQPAAGRS